MQKFYVEIETGNAAMSSTEDIQYALGEVIKKLNGQYAGSIRDINGNTVGEYGYRD